MTGKPRLSVLFVCMGNICRSPTAEGVFRHHVQQAGLAELITIASAGTHGYHIGAPPDPRSQAAAARRKYDLSHQRARQVVVEDFERFDYVLAMDRENLESLQQLASQADRDKPRLFLEYAMSRDILEVPDPYYGAGNGFELVLDLIEDASHGLLADIQTGHGLIKPHRSMRTD